jgi:REP element-mobilizing transposase RayT
MGRKYAIRDNEALYFVTFTVVYWIDVFIRDEYRQVFVNSTHYCQQHKGLEVYAYCMMPSHIHLIVGCDGEKQLTGIIRDWKSYTSRQLRLTLESHPQESRREWMLWMMKRAGEKNERNIDFQFWQQHNHPIQLDTDFKTRQRLDYIHQNPVKAGFVEKAEDWLWSSAGDYYGIRTGAIDIMFLF